MDQDNKPVITGRAWRKAVKTAIIALEDQRHKYAFDAKCFELGVETPEAIRANNMVENINKTIEILETVRLSDVSQ